MTHAANYRSKRRSFFYSNFRGISTDCIQRNEMASTSRSRSHVDFLSIFIDLADISEICAEKSKTKHPADFSAFSLVYYMQVI